MFLRGKAALNRGRFEKRVEDLLADVITEKADRGAVEFGDDRGEFDSGKIDSVEMCSIPK